MTTRHGNLYSDAYGNLKIVEKYINNVHFFLHKIFIADIEVVYVMSLSLIKKIVVLYVHRYLRQRLLNSSLVKWKSRNENTIDVSNGKFRSFIDNDINFHSQIITDTVYDVPFLQSAKQMIRTDILFFSDYYINIALLSLTSTCGLVYVLSHRT